LNGHIIIRRMIVRIPTIFWGFKGRRSIEKLFVTFWITVTIGDYRRIWRAMIWVGNERNKK
jgi:hypothetical protein